MEKMCIRDRGCAYKNMFEKDVPPPENAPVIEGKCTPLPREALEIALGISDIEEINAQIQECINGGKEKEVESVEKNLQATQGQILLRGLIYGCLLYTSSKLPIKWYGGADMSKLHDLTAAALFGVYKETAIIITHGFFPVAVSYTHLGA